MTTSKPKFRRETLWPFALAATITLCSGFPAATPQEMGWIEPDKFGHFAAYGALATAILRHPALAHPPSPFGLWRTGWLAVLLASGYGLGDEFRQAFGGVRMFEWADWVVDTAGAIVAVVLYLRWPAYRRLLERPVFRKRAKPQVEISAEPLPNPPA